MNTHTLSQKAAIPTATATATATAPTPTVWTVDDEGNIHFTLASNGFTCEQYLERRGWRMGDYVRKTLRNTSKAPTNGVNYHIVVRPGKMIGEKDRITKKIRATANKKGWLEPHWEVACLIRDTFTDEQMEQMGVWNIITMHEPIMVSDSKTSLLGSERTYSGRWINAWQGEPDCYWRDGDSFAFEVPQVGPQT